VQRKSGHYPKLQDLSHHRCFLSRPAFILVLTGVFSAMLGTTRQMLHTRGQILAWKSFRIDDSTVMKRKAGESGSNTRKSSSALEIAVQRWIRISRLCLPMRALAGWIIPVYPTSNMTSFEITRKAPLSGCACTATLRTSHPR